MTDKKNNDQALPWTGERYFPDVHGVIELEHVHRYLIAKQLAKNRRVLDVACGEGYGTALLSQVATMAIGVDISEAAVLHAKNKYYSNKNLEYRVGSCSSIPLENNSVDLVVSYETIEHHDEHEAMMTEIRRVLRPGGLLIISSPEKKEYSDKPGYKNPYHVKELYRNEFISLLDKHFKYFSISGQRVVFGSAIFSETAPSALKSYSMTDASRLAIGGIPDPLYLIALASDEQLPLLESGVLEQPIGSSEIVQAWAKEVASRDAQIEGYREQADRFDQLLRAANTRMAECNQMVVERDAKIASMADTLYSIYGSTGWRFLAPLRWYGRQCQRAKRIIRTHGLPLLGIRRKADVLSYASGTADATSENFRPEILFISHEATRTGAPIFLLNLIRFLKKELDVDVVILLRSGGDLEPEFRALGTTVVSADQGALSSSVLTALTGRNIRLVYSNTITNGVFQKSLLQLGCPILCHVHELAFSIENYFGQRNLSHVLESTSLFLAGSRAVSDYLRSSLQVPEGNVVLAYPFINIEHNRNAVVNCSSALSIPDDTIVVGACGMISHRKGCDLFAQIARMVLEKTSRPIMFVWVGGPLDHGEYPNIRHDITAMGIEKCLMFTGAVESHLPYLDRFDIFVLPSREDPFPLVVLDAASLGIPVVCFEKGGGAPELIEGDAGCVVPYMDLSGMASAVLDLVENDALRFKLGEAARAKVIARHDIKVGGKLISELIRPYLFQSHDETSE